MKRQLFSLAKTMKVSSFTQSHLKNNKQCWEAISELCGKIFAAFLWKKKKKKHFDCLQPPLSKMVYAGPGVNLIKLLHV